MICGLEVSIEAKMIEAQVRVSVICIDLYFALLFLDFLLIRHGGSTNFATLVILDSLWVRYIDSQWMGFNASSLDQREGTSHKPHQVAYHSRKAHSF